MDTTTQKPIQKTPAAAAVVTHDVADYQAWKTAFDAHAPERKAAGIVRTHVNRAADQPNRLSVYLAASTAAELKAFLASESLKAAMSSAGVTSAPSITLLTPVEDALNPKEGLAGVIVRHEVRDFTSWKRAFDAHGAARAAAGIVGHAINRGEGDPNLVVLYLQAESLQAVRAFAASESLKAAMLEAGVRGVPQIAFVQSAGWGQ